MRGCVFATGLALTGFGAMYFLAAVEDLPGNRTLAALHDGMVVPQDAIQAALASRQSAQGWVIDARRDRDIAFLRRTWAGMLSEKSPRYRELLELARGSLFKALSGIPVDAYSWTNLMIIETGLAAPPERLDALFQMAVLNAPIEERLVAWRLGFGLLNRGWLSQESQDLVRGQIRAIARLKPDILVNMARQLNITGEIAAYLESIGGYEEVAAKLVAPR